MRYELHMTIIRLFRDVMPYCLVDILRRNLLPPFSTMRTASQSQKTVIITSCMEQSPSQEAKHHSKFFALYRSQRFNTVFTRGHTGHIICRLNSVHIVTPSSLIYSLISSFHLPLRRLSDQSDCMVP
jgi:hypothetical protein